MPNSSRGGTCSALEGHELARLRGVPLKGERGAAVRFGSRQLIGSGEGGRCFRCMAGSAGRAHAGTARSLARRSHAGQVVEGGGGRERS